MHAMKFCTMDVIHVVVTVPVLRDSVGDTIRACLWRTNAVYKNRDEWVPMSNNYIKIALRPRQCIY